MCNPAFAILDVADVAAAHGDHTGEIGFVHADRTAVDAQAAARVFQGSALFHAPQVLDFGDTSLARDPDGFGVRGVMPHPS